MARPGAQVMKELRRLTDDAIAHALAALRVGGTLVPFLITEDEAGGLEFTQHLSAAGDADAVTQARQGVHHRGHEAVRYALVHAKGVKGRDGAEQPAVVVEAASRESPAALQLAQPYAPYRSPRELVEPVGKPLVLGDVENAFSLPAGSKPATLAQLSVVLVCAKCGRRNRVGFERLRRQLPKCGACKVGLATQKA